MAKAMAGRQVAVALEKAEAALDQAMAEIAGLAALLPGARLRAELSAVTGQRVFEGATETLALAAQARGRLVETHRRLEALNRALGSPVATGPVDKPEEDDGPPRTGGVTLERVAG